MRDYNDINHRRRHGILELMDHVNQLSICQMFVASTIGIGLGCLIAKFIFLCLLFSYEFIATKEVPLFTQEQLDQFMQMQKEMEAKELANVYVEGKCEITADEAHSHHLKDCVTNELPQTVRGLMAEAAEAAKSCFEYSAHRPIRPGKCIFNWWLLTFLEDKYDIDSTILQEHSGVSDSITLLAHSQYYGKNVAIHIFNKAGENFHSSKPLTSYSTDEKKAMIYDLPVLVEELFEKKKALSLSEDTFCEVDKAILKSKTGCFEYIAHFDKFEEERKSKETRFDFTPYRHKCTIGSDWYDLKAIMKRNDYPKTLTMLASYKESYFSDSSKVAIYFSDSSLTSVKEVRPSVNNTNEGWPNKAFIYNFESAYREIWSLALASSAIRIENSFSSLGARLGSGSFGTVRKYDKDKVMKILHELPSTVEQIALLKNEIDLLIEANKRAPERTIKLEAFFIGFSFYKLTVGLLFDDQGTSSSIDKALFDRTSDLYHAIREQPAKVISNYMEQSIRTLKEFAPSPSRPSIIHGDIKLDNILINKALDINFIDMGNGNYGNQFLNPFLCDFTAAPGIQKFFRLLVGFKIPQFKQMQQRILDEWLIPYKSAFDLQSMGINSIVMAQILFYDAGCEGMNYALTEEFRVKFGSNDFFDEYFYGYDFLISRKERILAQYEDINHALHHFFKWFFDGLSQFIVIDKKPEQARMVDFERVLKEKLSDSGELDNIIADNVAWAQEHTLEKMAEKWESVKFERKESRCP